MATVGAKGSTLTHSVSVCVWSSDFRKTCNVVQLTFND